MKILQLCTRVPFPPVDGGSIAMYNAEIALLSNHAQLKVLAFNTIKQYVDLTELDEKYKKTTSIEAVYLDNNINAFDAFFNLFSSQSYHLIRFIRKDFKQLLINNLKNNQYDVIQLESLFMVPYVDEIKKYSKAVIVLRAHNIEHLIWQRMAENCSNPFKKWYLNLLAKRLKNYEIKAINLVDAITTLTKEDQEAFLLMGTKKTTFVSPIGIQTNDYTPKISPQNQVIFHIGAMDWLPNQEGISWFLMHVWPIIKNKFPQSQLKLAGKKMPVSFLKFNDNRCEVQEFVPDAIDFMNQGEIMIVPLFSGSGMRVKIIEGLALGKAIITTSIGAEGIPAINRKHLIIANDKLEFIEAISELISNPKLSLELGHNARNLAESTFDNKEIGFQLINFYKGLSKNY